MNYLAHLYLSGNDDEIVVGNFIGDYVKGKDYMKYPEKIRKGILLHRNIDSFTDTHKNCRDAKEFFRKDFGLYSGIVVDFLYDHILGLYWMNYSNIELKSFAAYIHLVLNKHKQFLPKRVQDFLPFLIQHKRLESYATETGITHSMNIMSKYSSFPPKAERAMDIYRENKIYFTENFTHFMSGLIDFVEKDHGIILKKPSD